MDVETMNERKRRRMMLVGVLVVAIGAAWWWSTTAGDPAAPTRAATPVDTMVPPMEAPETSASRPSTASPPAPLPPSGTPLAESVPSLQALADAGHSQAACRLAVELLRCVHLEQARKYVVTPGGKPMDVVLAEQGQVESANRWAQIQIRQIELRQQCDAIDPELLAAAPRYLAEAARAGEPEAMLRYAARDQDGMRSSHAFARDPDFERWRLDAPGMLLRALQAGRPEAADLLAMAYRSDMNALSALFDDDPVQARAYQLLASRLRRGAENLGGLERPEEEARARALAEEWHHRHFDNRSFGYEAFPYGVPSLDFPLRAPQDERFCERPPG
jgi:hypothetical protein